MRNRILGLIALNIMVAIISSCATNRISLADKGLVSVNKHDSEKVRILWTGVYQQDGQTWAYGILKQRGTSHSAIRTHVDIQVLNSDGSVYYKTLSGDMYVPRNRVGKGPDWKRFGVQLPDELPKDSQINMTVHSGSHEESDAKS